LRNAVAGFAELVQARVDADERTEDSTEQYRAGHVEQVRRVDRELHAHRGHEQADAADDVLPQPFGQAIPTTVPTRPPMSTVAALRRVPVRTPTRSVVCER